MKSWTSYRASVIDLLSAREKPSRLVAAVVSALLTLPFSPLHALEEKVGSASQPPQRGLEIAPVRLATGLSYEVKADGKLVAIYGNEGDGLYSPSALQLPGALDVRATSSGIGGLGVAASFTLNEDQDFSASLAPLSSGYPGVSIGDYALLDTVDAVTLYLENQSGDLATIWPASYDAHHVSVVPGANGGMGSVRVGRDAQSSPAYSQPHFFQTLIPAITKNFVRGATMVDTLTVPACRGRITAWSDKAITVDRWVTVGMLNTPCGPNGNPQELKQPAGIGIAYVGARNAIWLQNGNLALDNIDTTTRAITDELAVYNRTGRYSEHGYDARFPGGLFPQADGPFVAGAIRFSSGTDPTTGKGGNGFQGTVAYAAAGDWEYGFWSRSARRAHFLVAPSDPSHIGAIGLLDTEPVGKSIVIRPGDRENTFSVDRQTGDVAAKGVVIPGMAVLASAPACDDDRLGAHFYISNGRKPGEPGGDGSGTPVDCSPPAKNSVPAWISVYDHLPVTD